MSFFLGHPVYGNRRQHIKSLRMIVETSDENKYSYFYVLNPFIKLPDPTMTVSISNFQRYLLAFIGSFF